MKTNDRHNWLACVIWSAFCIGVVSFLVTLVMASVFFEEARIVLGVLVGVAGLLALELVIIWAWENC